jgi:hybrid polyketide synthase / nonribosomal peptide synthetase ACE1
MLELTNLRPIRVGFCMGGLPGWWLGSAEDGREFCPYVTANEWNTILRKTGFAGIDTITPDINTEP